MEKLRDLTDFEKSVIIDKGTEAPFSGEFNDFYEKGNYHCKRCDAKLYASEDKFNSSCGWPSFDDEVKGTVKRKPDADGVRVEILCSSCDAHLGHVFEGEGFTGKNVRHCVNSVSMVFKPDFAKAYFAGGCFWGVEHLFQQKEGVISAVSGYMGGDLENPAYEDICRGDSGHLEVVEVRYNPEIVSYEDLTKFFFEIHDPTQSNGQGPDIGPQYLSAVFTEDDGEREVVRKLIGILTDKGFDVVTKILERSRFWVAEEYHQDYYEKKNSKPYCHFYTRKF